MAKCRLGLLLIFLSSLAVLSSCQRAEFGNDFNGERRIIKNTTPDSYQLRDPFPSTLKSLIPADQIAYVNDTAIVSRVLAHEMVTVIDRLPYYIFVPGLYVVSKDLKTNGHGIRIFASSVYINLDQHTIQGPKSLDTQAIGIYAQNQRDIQIFNGTIEGFMYAVYLSDSIDSVYDRSAMNYNAHLVENLHIKESTFRGLRIEGKSNVVRGNLIEEIGGCSVYSTSYGMGIESFGQNAIIEDNAIRNVRGVSAELDIGEAVGISVSRFGSGSIVSRNVIFNDALEPDRTYPHWRGPSRSSYGIWLGGDGSQGLQAFGNYIENYAYGITWKRTVAGSFARNVIHNSYVPFYIPYGDGVRVVDQGANQANMANDYLALRRQTPGPVEVVEKIYLPPLYREMGWVYRPINDLNQGDDIHNGDRYQLDIVNYWGALSPVLADLQLRTAEGAGHDTLSSVEGVQGGLFADELYGDFRQNLLIGSEGEDILDGRQGQDMLIGGDGNDELFGGPGNDILEGGTGHDNLYGGDGADTFRYLVVRSGIDRIKDFEAGADKIDLSEYFQVARSPYTELLSFMHENGNNLELRFDAIYDVLIIENMTFARMLETDFIFRKPENPLGLILYRGLEPIDKPLQPR